ncbi:MAG: AAA family ATPase, partial [Bacteroidetes bacterium]|nr:AAA family ATPase [Bacteroidota bacterium]
MYKIKRIKLSNIRGFRNLELNIINEDQNPRNRTLIIGTNGTCKTTLLRTIIFGISDYQDTAALLAEDNGFFVRQNARESIIEVEVFDEKTNDEPINIFSTFVQRNGKDVVSKKMFQGVKTKKKYQGLNKERTFICSYGAGRSVEGP